MTDEQKRRPQNTKTWRKDEGKSIGHQRAVCLGIKEDKSNQWQEMFMVHGGNVCGGNVLPRPGRGRAYLGDITLRVQGQWITSQ